MPHAGTERAFTGLEVERDGFAAGGNVAGFGETEPGAARQQRRESGGETGGDAGHGPEADGGADADAEPRAIDEQPGERSREGVDQRERGDHPAELQIVDAELGLDRGRERRKNLAVQIAERGGEHEDEHHSPARRNRWEHVGY